VVAVGVVQYAPIVTCQRMVGRIGAAAASRALGPQPSARSSQGCWRRCSRELMPGLRGRGEGLTLVGEGPENVRCVSPVRGDHRGVFGLPRARHPGIERAHPRVDGLQPIRPGSWKTSRRSLLFPYHGT